MTKQEFLDKLREYFDEIDAIAADVDDIMSTPLEDLNDLIYEKKSNSYYYGKDNSQGIYTRLSDLLDDIGNMISELEEDEEVRNNE